MKKLFTILGVAFSVIIIGGIITFGVLFYQGSGLDEESEAYVNNVTPIILTAMDKETLFTYADQELIDSASTDEFEKIFSWFRTLGQLQDYKGCTGQANINLNETGKTITAYYEANASFEKGDAIIKVTSIKRGEEWKIYGFHINSTAFIQ